MEVSIAEGDCQKDFTMIPRFSRNGKVTGTRTGYTYKPTWRLSTSHTLGELKDDASYVRREDILFSSSTFELSYKEQVILLNQRLVIESMKGRKKKKFVKQFAQLNIPRDRAVPGHIWQQSKRNKSYRRKKARKDLFAGLVERKVWELISKEHVFAPHVGAASQHFVDGLDQVLKGLSTFAGEHITDEILSEIEGVLALLFALEGTSDFVSACAVMALYLRKYFDKSMSMQALDYIQDFFLEPQAGDENEDLPVGGGRKAKDWVDMMKNLHGNWGLVRDNKLFGHLSKILGLVVTMEMCKASDVTFSIKEFKLLEPDIKVMHGSAVDVVDAALGSVSFFVEVGSMCWATNSLKPLILNDTAAMEIDEEYAILLSSWELVRNGNLGKVRGMSDHEFDKRLEVLSEKLRQMIPGLKGFDKKIVQDKFLRLLNIKNDYITMKISSGIREAPFAVELFGESSQGKSTFGEQVLAGMLASAGMPTGKEYQATYNASDKYMSTWTTDKLVMIVDDLANEKSDFVERPPTRAIIDLCNNQAYYANMADLGSKGKVFVEPALVLVTTNVKDLDARAYSNCPYSIQRRMHVVITVTAKDEFQYKDSKGKSIGIDSAAIARAYEDLESEPLFDDVWNLSIERAVKPEKLSSAAGYEPIMFNGKPLKNISFLEALNYLIYEFQSHRKSQEAIVRRMKRRQQNMEKCGVQGCVQIRGYCMKHVYPFPEGSPDATHENVPAEVPEGLICEDVNDPHWGEELTDALTISTTKIYNRVSKDVFGISSIVEKAAVCVVLQQGREFAKHWDWMKIVPSSWIKNKKFYLLAMLLSKQSIKRKFIRNTIVVWALSAGTSAYTYRKHRKLFLPVSVMSTTAALVLQKEMVSLVKSQFRRDLEDRNAIEPMFQSLRDKHVTNMCKAGGIVAVLYGISKVYKIWRGRQRIAQTSTQGSLEPTTQEEVDARDAEASPWTGVVKRPLPVQTEAVNTTSNQLIGLVDKNLTYGSVKTDDGTLAVNCLFLRPNVVVIPQHYFKQENLEVVFQKEKPEQAAGAFKAILNKNKAYFLPDSDLALAYVPSGGSFKELGKYLPNGTMNRVEFEIMYRSKEGSLTQARGLADFCVTGHSEKTFEGLSYKSLTMNTRPGLCGAVLTSSVKPLILGFHLGGQTGTPKGCAGILTRDEYEKGLVFLRSLEGVLLTGSGEQFDECVMGVNVLTHKPLHKKSPVRFQPHGSQIQWFGTCVGHSTFKSSAKPTLITEHVTDVMGEPNIYCGPIESPQWEPWQTAMENMALPATQYEWGLLDVAIRDYKASLIPIFQHDMWNKTTPLSDLENWNGVPGKKFLDRIKANTSIGFPLKGKKSKYLVEVEPFDKYTKIVEPVPIIQKEIDRLINCYSRGERAFPIAKACKKDEILAKRKCRIFFSNPVAFTFLVRKYFLPILRILQFYPKLSECAVGVNSHGPEWDELYGHMVKHGSDRLFGGDYGKYDQKLCAQLLIASMRILIDFACYLKYDPKDLAIMETMVGDLVYAIIEYNGDLVGLTEGSHISGNSLTVILNGICGSLNMRCYFYSNNMKPGDVQLSFRDYVALVTYGDDNIGSVSKKINNFNIKGASEFLARYGQVYTMPDKESELLEFLAPQDFEFLKRKSVYHPKLGVHVGALVEKSCFKMLHFYLRDKKSENTEEYACALNIDTANREWFNHGEEVYEKRREQLREVAELSGIGYLCETLNETYDDRVLQWKEKYESF